MHGNHSFPVGAAVPNMWHMCGRIEATKRGMVAAEAAFRFELQEGVSLAWYWNQFGLALSCFQG